MCACFMVGYRAKNSFHSGHTPSLTGMSLASNCCSPTAQSLTDMVFFSGFLWCELVACGSDVLDPPWNMRLRYICSFIPLRVVSQKRTSSKCTLQVIVASFPPRLTCSSTLDSIRGGSLAGYIPFWHHTDSVGRTVKTAARKRVASSPNVCLVGISPALEEATLGFSMLRRARWRSHFGNVCRATKGRTSLLWPPFKT